MRQYDASVFLGLLCVFIISWPPSSVHAQRFGRFEEIETNVGAYYHFVQAGRPTIQVHVLGAVASPGLYEVNDGTPFGTLLTLARPLMPAGGRSERKVDMDDIVVSVFRRGSANDGPVFSRTLEEVMMRPNENPALQDGDVLAIQAPGGGIGWRDVLNIAQAVAVFVLALSRLGRAL